MSGIRRLLKNCFCTASFLFGKNATKRASRKTKLAFDIKHKKFFYKLYDVKICIISDFLAIL